MMAPRREMERRPVQRLRLGDRSGGGRMRGLGGGERSRESVGESIRESGQASASGGGGFSCPLGGGALVSRTKLYLSPTSGRVDRRGSAGTPRGVRGSCRRRT